VVHGGTVDTEEMRLGILTMWEQFRADVVEWLRRKLDGKKEVA
jgi:hypothetical protein